MDKKKNLKETVEKEGKKIVSKWDRVLKGKTEKETKDDNLLGVGYQTIIDRKISDEKVKTAVKDVLKEAFIQQEGFDRLMTFYKCAIMEVETKFNVLNQEFSMKHDRNPICSIQSRLKSYDSIMEKCARRGWGIDTASIEKNMTDIAGIRVVCTFTNDVYMLAQSLLAQDDINLIVKKDYISRPKESGYRSLHLIISVPIFLETEKKDMKVEVQIRTLSMDCWATMEHQLRYKKEHIFTEDMSQELLDCAKYTATIDDLVEGLRKKVLKD